MVWVEETHEVLEELFNDALPKCVSGDFHVESRFLKMTNGCTLYIESFQKKR
jgi:hypothetical protein